MATLGRLAEVTRYESDFRRVAGISLGGYVVRAEHLAAVKADGLAVAGDVLTIAGAKPERERGTSHYVAYQADGWRGLAHRGGSGSARFELARSAAPYNRGASFTDKAARAYLATHAMPLGAQPAWNAWRDLARELCAARYQDESDAYTYADAWRSHMAGESPFAYALAAHRKAAGQ